jgi:hypothetical protein
MEDNETTTYIVWLDSTILMLFSFVVIVCMMLASLNPPKPEEANSSVVPGTMMVEIIWADRTDTDIDLWVKAPGDTPVGYSAKAGRTFNLLRDDLGMASDTMPLNYEVAYTRGCPEGEYIINVHAFSDRGGKLPLEVRASVTIQNPLTKTSRNIATKTITLTRVGEELTVFRFRLDGYMNLVSGSMNDIQHPLRSAAK